MGTIIGFAGSLTSCPVSTSSCGDGGPATSAMLNSPAGISLDSSGNVYISGIPETTAFVKLSNM